MSRWPCKDYLRGTCTTPFCEKWHPPECLFYKSENGCRFGVKCSYAHCQVDKQKVKKNGDKSAVAILKITRQLGLRISGYGAAEVYNDFAEELKHTETNTMCVRFTRAVLRHANIRDQHPSLGMICPGDPQQRNPNAPKFEDRSREETEWQEQGAREAAWKLAKNILEFKEKNKAAFSHLRKIGVSINP